MQLRFPGQIVIDAVQPAGPFPAGLGRGIVFPDTSVRIDNPGPDSVQFSCELEPVYAQSGRVCVSALRLEGADDPSVPLDLAPGSSVELRLAPGTDGVLGPGEYSSRLAIHLQGESGPALVPIRLRVRAHWGWLMGLLLLGLSFVSGMSLIDAEGKVKQRLAEIHGLQEALAEVVAPYPGDSDIAVRAGGIDRDLRWALTLLERPRPLSVVDWRMERAARFQKQAETQLKALRAAATKASPGEVAVKSLQEQLQGIEKGIGEFQRQQAARRNEAGTGSAPDRWLQKLLQKMARASVEPLALTVQQYLAPQVSRAEWFLLAGEDDRAVRLAAEVRPWLERAAARLRRALELQAGWELNARNLLFLYQGLQAGIDAGVYTPEQRTALADALGPARKIVSGEVTLVGFRELHRLVQEARTLAVRLRSQRLLEKIRPAIQEADRAAGIDRIVEFVSGLKPSPTPQEKRQNLQALVNLWRKWLADQPPGEVLAPISERVERLQRQLDAKDMQGMASTVPELVAQWESYHADRVAAESAAVLGPYCADMKRGLLVELAVVRESRRLLAPHPDLEGMEVDLDALERELAQLEASATCLDRLVGLEGRLLALGDRAFRALLQSSEVTDDARLEAAIRSTDQEAVSLALDLMQKPWPIHLAIETPPHGRFAGSETRFRVDALKPSWHGDIRVSIDYGDGTMETQDADSLRKQGLLAHRYTGTGHYVVTLRARAVDPVSGEARTVGEARSSLLVRESPASRMRQLASELFNLRFMLALGIALLVGSWRFAGNPLFGARKRDYLEAFATGFGANLGVDGLASWVAKVAG